MKQIKNRLKSVCRIFWEYKYSIAAVLLVFGVALGSVHYVRNGRMAWAHVSFQYSEASSGLNPNNTRFNAYELMSEEVLNRAITLAGLQDTLTAKELSACVNVLPVDTGNAGGDDQYISTTYAISLDSTGLSIQNRTAMNLLENLCQAYKNYFLENNGDNQEILRLNLEVSEASEPYLRLNEIKLRANQLARYLSARMNQNRTFADEEGGMSFDAFDKRLKNMISYDIPNTAAFIIECGVAGDAETLTEILAYKNKMDAISADKQMAYYEADNNGIAMYEKLMSSIIMIPTMDEQEQYYMSRTKTAMDKMARNADSELAEATDYRKEIVSTDYVIKKMKESRTGEAELAAARTMINRLEEGLNELSEELRVFDQSYIEYKAQNYITFHYYEQSFLGRIDVKKTAEELLVLILLFAAGVYLYTGRKERQA